MKPGFEEHHNQGYQLSWFAQTERFSGVWDFSAKIRKVPDKLGEVGHLNCTR